MPIPTRSAATRTSVAGRSFTPSQIQARHRVGAWLGRYQAWLFFPMLLLEGLHLHIAGMRALLGHSGRARWAEAGLLAVHIGGYLTAVFVVLPPVQAVVFLVVQQGLFGVYLGSSFAPNHKGMPVVGEDEKVDFLRRQVLTSRNIRGSWLTDLALGGLNYQRLSTTCSRPCRARVCVTPRRRCGRYVLADRIYR